MLDLSRAAHDRTPQSFPVQPRSFNSNVACFLANPMMLRGLAPRDLGQHMHVLPRHGHAHYKGPAFDQLVADRDADERPPRFANRTTGCLSDFMLRSNCCE